MNIIRQRDNINCLLSKTKSIRRILGVLFIFSIVGLSSFPMSPSDVSAGSFDNHKFDVTVGIDWEATPTELNALHDTFQEFNELLYDATDGTHQLDEVKLFNGPTLKDDADVHIKKVTTRERESAHVLGMYGLLAKWQHMFMNSMSDPETYLHEFGHYGYGLWDEYSDTGHPDTCSGCIMNNQWSWNEFCTPSNHENNDNEQEIKHGVSCWEYMAYGEADWKFWAFQGYADLRNVIPTGDADPGPTTGADSISWIVEDHENPYTVLLIDRSGSMSGQKLADAKTAAKQFIDLLGIGDHIAVVSYASDVTTDFALAEITSDTVKTNAKGAIDTLTDDGLTAMGDGLRQCYNILNFDTSAEKNIILLSNGYHNHGSEDPDDVLPALKSEDIEVYTIGLGTTVAEDLLKRIASETQGNYMYAPSSTTLLNLYNSLAYTTKGWQSTNSSKDLISQGEIKYEEAYIDSSYNEVIFSLTWEDGELNFTLETPNNIIINPDYSITNSSVSFYQDIKYKIYKIMNPQNGTWTLNIEGINISCGNTNYSFNIAGESNITLGCELPVESHFPEPIPLSAVLYEFYPIGMASNVSTIISRNGLEICIMPLFDDGNNTHNDVLYNDGVYSNILTVFEENGRYNPHPNYFDVFEEEGIYNFEIRVAANGSAISGPFNSPDGTINQSDLTEQFYRERKISTFISGIASAESPNGKVYFGSYNGSFKNSLITTDKSALPTAGSIIASPYGFFSFNLTGLSANQTIDLLIYFPDELANDYDYWNYGPTPNDPVPHWYQVPIISNPSSNNIMMIQLTDGGIGDHDGYSDGRIVTLGGPAKSITDGHCGVGGDVHPVGKLDLLAPYFTATLAITVLIGLAAVSIRRRNT